MIRFTAVAVAVALSLVACNGADVETEIKKVAKMKLDPQLSPKVRKMVTQDLVNLKDFEVTLKGAETRWFKEIFGGTTGLHVLGFLNDRIQYLMQDVPETTRLGFEFEDWASDPELEARMKKMGGVVGAYNAGTALWYMAVMNNAKLYYHVGKDKVLIDSPRAGLMGFGPGYRSRELKVIPIPSIVRQSILVHEGRHSDCTGGLNGSDLAEVRHSKSFPEFMKNFKKPQCGHWHSYCPKDHALADIPACDNHAWGSYAVGAIFLQQMNSELEATKGGWYQRAISKAIALDSFSRITINAEAMLVGKYGKPDMVHGTFNPSL